MRRTPGIGAGSPRSGVRPAAGPRAGRRKTEGGGAARSGTLSLVRGHAHAITDNMTAARADTVVERDRVVSGPSTPADDPPAASRPPRRARCASRSSSLHFDADDLVGGPGSLPCRRSSGAAARGPAVRGGPCCYWRSPGPAGPLRSRRTLRSRRVVRRAAHRVCSLGRRRGSLVQAAPCRRPGCWPGR